MYASSSPTTPSCGPPEPWELLADDGIDIISTASGEDDDVAEWDRLDASSPYWGVQSTKEVVWKDVQETRRNLGEVRRCIITISGAWVWNHLCLKLAVGCGDFSSKCTINGMSMFDVSVSMYLNAVRAWDRMTYAIDMPADGDAIDLNDMHARFLACLYWSMRSLVLSYPTIVAVVESSSSSSCFDMSGFIEFASELHSGKSIATTSWGSGPGGVDLGIPRFDRCAFERECKAVWESNACQSPRSFLSLDRVIRGATSSHPNMPLHKKCMVTMMAVIWSDLPFYWSQVDLGMAVVLAAAFQTAEEMDCMLACIPGGEGEGEAEGFAAGGGQDDRKAIIRSLARELLLMHGEVSSRLLMPFMGGGLSVSSPPPPPP